MTVRASREQDVIIVGGGVVGAACADALSRDGRRVLVLEADIVGGGTTAAAMGHLVVMDDSPAQLALTAYSVRLWRELFQVLPANLEVDRCGTLWVAEDDAQLTALREKQRAYASVGVDTEVLDAHATAEAEPALRPGLAGSLRVATDAVVYPPVAALALMARARDRGTVVREHAGVTRIVPHGVECHGEWIEAEFVVNAAGAAAPDLTPGLPIVPRKGHLAITDRYPRVCRHQLVELGYLASAHEMTTESVAFNLQPRSTGQLLIGSSRELVGWDRSLNPAILGRMLARAADFVPVLADLSVIRVWTGFRPTTPDKLPLIGPWNDQGLIVAAGHEGLGIATAAATGQLVADLIAGRESIIDARPFLAARAHDRVTGMQVVA